MFDKNDKPLLTAKIVFDVTAWIGVILGLVCAVISFANGLISQGFICLLVVPFCGWIGWIIARLWLTYLCDVKLIRNKLYDINNENLKVFLEDKMTAEEVEEKEKIEKQKSDKIAHLKSLRDSGVITEEEFQQEREKIIK